MGDPTTRKLGRAGVDRPISNPEERTPRDALARVIGSRLALCSIDDLRVLDVVLGRLELGRQRYGFLDLSKARDWEREEAEEHLDAAVYRACGKLVEHDQIVNAIIDRDEDDK